VKIRRRTNARRPTGLEALQRSVENREKYQTPFTLFEEAAVSPRALRAIALL
jgi:hypothetical protein